MSFKKSKYNRFKSIVVTDRYGVTYTKNFMISPDGVPSLQRFDSQNLRTKHIFIEKAWRKKYGK